MKANIEMMIESNKKLIYSIATKLYRKNKNYDKEDLIQVGTMSLYKNGGKYDKKRGRVSTFITHCVKNDMIKFIKANSDKSLELFDNNYYVVDYDNEVENIVDTISFKNEFERDIVLARLEGLSNRQIGLRLGVSESKISKALSTIRSRVSKIYA